MKRKKILWLCSWYPSGKEPFNGDFIQRHAKAAALYNDIYVIHIYGLLQGENKDLNTEIFQSNGLTEQIIYYRKSKSIIGKIISSLREIRILRKNINDYINKFGKPDLVHVHIPYKLGLAGIWIKKKFFIPYIVTEHWGIYNLSVAENYNCRSFIFKHIVKKVFKNANRFLSVSNFLGKGVNEFVVRRNFDVVPNVVDTNLFCPVKKNNRTFRFIHVSNMVGLKNAEGILNAFQKFLHQGSEAELVMVGDTKPEIRKYAENLGFPAGAVSFKGEISYDQVAMEMQESDCLVLFSIMENSPCVICEALCCGLPVIATAVGGVPELLSTENSIQVQPGDEQDLVGAMRNMIQKENLFERNKIADNARSKFSYETIGKKLDAVYTEVLTGI